MVPGKTLCGKGYTWNQKGFFKGWTAKEPFWVLDGTFFSKSVEFIHTWTIESVCVRYCSWGGISKAQKTFALVNE
jgi:hypothetical protein